MIWSLVAGVAQLWPLSTPERPPLRRAVAFLGWPVEPDQLTGASYATATTLAVLGLTVNALLGGIVGAVLTACCLLGGGVVLGTGRLVESFARARRASALGTAPALITRATLRMQLTPAPEAAAQFGARTTPGSLGNSLAAHVRRTANGPRTGLQSFAREWADWFPELERACSLLDSAGREPPSDRTATLQRARRVVLDGIRDRTEAFATSITGPVTALYAFGVLLPLSLVALLPALDAAGMPASIAALVVVYDLILPLAVLATSGWLLAKRPVAFRPTSAPRSHPDVPTEHWHCAVAGIGAALGTWVITNAILPVWAASLAAVGCGTAVGLLVAYQPMQSVRDRGNAVEAGLIDALSLIGRRVERGTAAECALDSVATEVPGATGEVFETAAQRQRRLGVDIETAFTGENGALATVSSDRAASAAALLALSASEGRPAGTALVAMGEHLETIDTVEQESKRAMGSVTSTLSNTAAVFGPLVGGATVALTAAMGSNGPLGGSVAIAHLGLAIGWYILVLAVLLTTLATGLTHGLDRPLLGYRIGLALLAATATYLTAFVAAGLLI